MIHIRYKQGAPDPTALFLARSFSQVLGSFRRSSFCLGRFRFLGITLYEGFVVVAVGLFSP